MYIWELGGDCGVGTAECHGRQNEILISSERTRMRKIALVLHRLEHLNFRLSG